MKLSVVMAVYNGARTLRATLASIAAQRGVAFELLVVDDGSTDETPAILAQQQSLRVITQPNAGLTRALIRGCAEATGDVIARHDCGDVSHPDRFARQLRLLAEGHVLIACTTTFVTPEGDRLYEARAEGEEVRRSLLEDPVDTIRGLPHHGSAMFRRDAYLAAGGYRPQFRIAQDLDLWIRMARLGTIGIDSEPLYRAVVDPHGISSTAREAQVRAAELSIAMRDGGDAAALLAEVEGIVPAKKRDDAAGYYFIARCLMKEKNPRWRAYLWRALRARFL